MWLHNDEPLWRLVDRSIRTALREGRNHRWAAGLILAELEELGVTHTPDGYRYSLPTVALAIQDDYDEAKEERGPSSRSNPCGRSHSRRNPDHWSGWPSAEVWNIWNNFNNGERMDELLEHSVYMANREGWGPRKQAAYLQAILAGDGITVTPYGEDRLTLPRLTVIVRHVMRHPHPEARPASRVRLG